MDDVLDEFIKIAKRCERASLPFKRDPLDSICKNIHDVINQVNESWSQSWIGKQANLYLKNLQKQTGNEFFDIEWGFAPNMVSSRTTGEWYSFEYNEVLNIILERAGLSDLNLFEEAANQAKETFESGKSELLPTMEAIIADNPDENIKSLYEKIKALENCLPSSGFIELLRPNTFVTHDTASMALGIRVPPHIQIRTWLFEQQSYGSQSNELAKITRHIIKYLEQRHKMKGKSVAKTEGKIFLGHGRSLLWRELKDFIEKKLHLDTDEFNSEPQAGFSTTERLQNMVDEACFAFLILTGEDEHPDQSIHARENVIHEAGLFQGRLGFERAIILLEEGCSKFSNIDGLTVIPFQKGNISAVFEKVRDALERENIL